MGYAVKVIADNVKYSPEYRDMHPGLLGAIRVKAERGHTGNKYTPHQGYREKIRRLSKIYEKHPFDCPCKSCEYFDAIIKSRTE